MTGYELLSGKREDFWGSEWPSGEGRVLTWPPRRRRFEAWRPRLFVGSELALPGRVCVSAHLGNKGKEDPKEKEHETPGERK